MTTATVRPLLSTPWELCGCVQQHTLGGIADDFVATCCAATRQPQGASKQNLGNQTSLGIEPYLMNLELVACLSTAVC